MRDMVAIITELEEQAAVRVMRLWRELNEACGLEGIFNFPTPHFTWFVAEKLDIQEVKSSVQKLSEEIQTFEIRTYGLGVFPGDQPVLYLPIVRTIDLIQLHQKIWDLVLPFSVEASTYYSPQLWMPHITLALMDLTQENLSCAIDSIAFEPIEIHSEVDNLALVEQEGQEIGETLQRFNLALTKE